MPKSCRANAVVKSVIEPGCESARRLSKAAHRSDSRPEPSRVAGQNRATGKLSIPRSMRRLGNETAQHKQTARSSGLSYSKNPDTLSRFCYLRLDLHSTF